MRHESIKIAAVMSKRCFSTVKTDGIGLDCGVGNLMYFSRMLDPRRRSQAARPACRGTHTQLNVLSVAPCLCSIPGVHPKEVGDAQGASPESQGGFLHTVPVPASMGPLQRLLPTRSSSTIWRKSPGPLHCVASCQMTGQ